MTGEFHDPATLTSEWAAQPVLTSQRMKNSLASAGNPIPGHQARNLHINRAPYSFHARYERYITAKRKILELNDSIYSSVGGVT